MSDTTIVRPAAEGSGTSSPASADPVVNLLERLQRLSDKVPEGGRGLEDEIAEMLKAAKEPGATSDPVFRTRLAYLVQDWPKFSGSLVTVVLAPPLQAEMTERAAAYPGLENPRMKALLQGTERLRDRKLVADIRSAAAEVAGFGKERQSGAIVSEFVKGVEQRVQAVAARAASAGMATDVGVGASAAAQESGPTGGARSPEGKPAQTGQDASSTAQSSKNRDQANSISDRIDTTAEARPTMSPEVPSSKESAAAPTVAKPGVGPAAPTSAPSNGSFFGDRLSTFGRRLHEDKVKEASAIAEKAATQAVDALERFLTGPGREIGNKITAAAQHEAGGITDVIAEMKPDGRHADLRQAFDAKLKTDPAFMSAYEEAVQSSEKYFRKRQQASVQAKERGVDFTAHDAAAQSADAKIGQSTAGIPGREAGKSLLDELGKRAVEMVEQVLRAIKSLLGQGEGQQVRRSPSPSPG